MESRISSPLILAVSRGRLIGIEVLRPNPCPLVSHLLGKRDSFLLRTDPKVLDALRRWADDELRSANGQIEFLLRAALRDAGRLPEREPEESSSKKTTPQNKTSTSRNRSRKKS